MGSDGGCAPRVPTMATIAARIYSTLIFIAVIGLFLGLSGYEIIRNLREVLFFEWTTGTVTACLAPDKNAEKDLEAGRLEFTYRVDGAQYEGRYPPEYWIDMPRAPYPILDRAWEVGGELDVYYAPSDPATCTLAPRIEPFPFGIITFVLPFVVLGFLVVRDGESINVLFDTRHSVFLPAYSMLSVIAAFAVMIAGKYFGWRIGVTLGVVLPTIVVPGCVWLLVRWSERRDVRGRRASRRPFAAQVRQLTLDGLRAEAADRDRAGKHPRRNTAVLALATLVWWGATILFLVPPIVAFAQYLDADGRYLETEGLVLESRLKETHGSDTPSYRPIVIYQYDVDGKTYRGDRVMFGVRDVSWPHDDAEAVRRNYPEGERIRVHYDPGHPGQSVLDTDVVGRYAHWAFGMSGFVTGGVIMLVSLVWPGLASGNSRIKRVVQWGLGTCFITQILSIFFLGAGGGYGTLPVRIGLGVIAVAVLVAVAAALLTYRPPTDADRLRRP
jgi:hypothetical protein